MSEAHTDSRSPSSEEENVPKEQMEESPPNASLITEESLHVEISGSKDKITVVESVRTLTVLESKGTPSVGSDEGPSASTDKGVDEESKKNDISSGSGALGKKRLEEENSDDEWTDEDDEEEKEEEELPDEDEDDEDLQTRNPWLPPRAKPLKPLHGGNKPPPRPK